MNAIILPRDIVCARCDELMSASAFGLDRSRKSGRHPYCKACHREYMREYRRRTNEKDRLRHRYATDEAYRAKVKARKRVYMARRRAGLPPMPCSSCGADRAEAHHPDYSQPTLIVWLCKICHEAEHHDVSHETISSDQAAE